MAERIGGQAVLVRLTVILVGIILLIVPFSLLPELGIDSASYGSFLVFVTGFVIVFLSVALWIGRRSFGGRFPTTKRDRVRAVLVIAGITLLVSPISTGRGLGISGVLVEIAAVVIGIGLLVVVLPTLTKVHTWTGFGNPRLYPTLIMVFGVIGFLMIAFFVPVRSEPTGWYYYTDQSGCTSEYRLGTGPDPSPPQQSITGMYYNLWGMPMEHAYPSGFDYQVCS